MSLAGHPKYQTWELAYGHLVEALEHHRNAVKSGTMVGTAKLDLDKAMAAYDEICKEMGEPVA